MASNMSSELRALLTKTSQRLSARVSFAREVATSRHKKILRSVQRSTVTPAQITRALSLLFAILCRESASVKVEPLMNVTKKTRNPPGRYSQTHVQGHSLHVNAMFVLDCEV